MCPTVPLGLGGTEPESSLEWIRFRSRSGRGKCLVLSPDGTAAAGSGVWQETCGADDASARDQWPYCAIKQDSATSLFPLARLHI